MLLLSLIWLISGLLIGCLAWGANLLHLPSRKYQWLFLPAFGAFVAFLIGWFDTLLQGTFFATFTVIWFTILSLIAFAMIVRYRRENG